MRESVLEMLRTAMRKIESRGAMFQRIPWNVHTTGFWSKAALPPLKALAALRKLRPHIVMSTELMQRYRNLRENCF